MEKVTTQVMKLKIALIKREEPMVNEDGFRWMRATYTVQYLTRDNYVLAERSASEFDRQLFGKFSKSPCNDVEQRLSILEGQFKECQKTANSMGDIVCKLIREIAETYGLLDEDFDKKFVEVEQKYKKVL